MSTLVLLLDDRASQHLARALGEHQAWCRRNGVPLPPALADLLDVLTDGCGRSRTDPATGWTFAADGVHDLGVSLFSYAEAAGRLRCSARTVGRLVAAGKLTRVGKRVTRASVAALAGGASR